MATYRVEITQGQISCKDYGAVAQPHSKLRDLKRLRASKSLMYTFSPVMIRIIGRRSQPSLAVSRHSCQSSDICRDGYVFSLIFEHVRLGVCHNVWLGSKSTFSESLELSQISTGHNNKYCMQESAKNSRGSGDIHLSRILVRLVKSWTD
jgi:hypothetical protein